jgi:ABC-2 type transport system permease protein
MQVLPQRKVLLLIVLAWLGPIIKGVTLFGKLRATDLITQILGEQGAEVGAGFFWGAISDQGFWILIFVVLVGSNLIAADRRFKALQLYFSKPLTPLDYILGKLGIVGAFLIVTVWVPILLLWLFGLMIEPSLDYFQAVWFVPLSLTLYTLLLIAVAGLLILALSAVGQKGVFVAGAWIILFGYGPFQLVILLLRELSGQAFWSLLSLERDLDHVGAWLFGRASDAELHPLTSLVVLLLVAAACFTLLRRRIRPVEVVL